jgi:hypothetical protein
VGGELPHWGPEILYHPLRANCCVFVFYFILFCFGLVFFYCQDGAVAGEIARGF